MEVRSSQAFSNTHTKELTYLYTGGTPFAIHEKNGEDEALYYLHLDYQGSIRAISNEQGNIVEQRDYDAWGRPRNPVTLNYTAANPFTHSLNTAIITSRGYTFHEHIFEFSLINMKVPSKQVQSHACMSYAEREVLRGVASTRMYDPVTRRVISPDNYIQAHQAGASNIYLRNSCLISDKKLFYVLDHELIHASHYSDGSFAYWRSLFGHNRAITISEIYAYKSGIPVSHNLGLPYTEWSKSQMLFYYHEFLRLK